MAHLGPVAIAKLMRAVGFVQPQAPQGTTPGFDPHSYTGDAVVMTGVAVCLAESGGDPNRIHHNKDGSTDYGLWQINDQAHADLFKHYNWRDPQQNTEMAYHVWHDAGDSFSPWVAYQNNSYKTNLGKGKQGLTGAVKDYQRKQSPQHAAKTIGHTVGQALNPFAALMDPSLWKRVGLILGAVLLLIIGVIVMLESNTTTRKLTETAALA